MLVTLIKSNSFSMNNNTASHKRVDHAHFLNRVALEYECNPHKLHLLSVLKDFFNYANVPHHLDMFDKLCIAAMHQQYTWNGGSPGNGLFYAERLEMLIEAAYLLHKHRGSKPRKKAKHKADRVAANELPMYLSSSEYLQPFTFLDSFFAHATLQRWKKMLNGFMSNALSNSSVTEELAPEELLPFVCYMKKLICAAYRITLLHKKDA